MRAYRTEGFSLIELLTAVTVLVVLLTLAIPAMGPFIQRQRIKSAAMDMESSVTFARSEAIKRNVSVYVIAAGASWSGGWTVATTAPSTPTTAIRGAGALDGINIAEKGGATQLSFGGDGRLQTSSLAFTMQSSVPGSTQQPVCVSISTAGRTQTVKGGC